MGGLNGGGGELLVGGLAGGLDCCGKGDDGMVGGLTRVVGYLADMSGVCLGYLKAMEGNCCLEASQEGWTVAMEDTVMEVLVWDLKTVEVYLRRRGA